MKTEYRLRPNTKHETHEFPKIVQSTINGFDDAEQSYFRNNPHEIGKNPKIAKAIRINAVVAKVVEWRIAKLRWSEIGERLQAEFGISPSVSTLRRWSERAL